jgi:hypothetical protein
MQKSGLFRARAGLPGASRQFLYNCALIRAGYRQSSLTPISAYRPRPCLGSKHVMNENTPFNNWLCMLDHSCIELSALRFYAEDVLIAKPVFVFDHGVSKQFDLCVDLVRSCSLAPGHRVLIKVILTCQ